HGAENGAQMAFEGLHGDVFDVVNGFAEKLLGGGGDGDVIALHFDLRDAVHAHGNTFAGVNFGRLDIDSEQFEREDVVFFQHGNDESAAALDDAKPARSD